MVRRSSGSRQVILLAASALGLHSLRYLLAPVADPTGLANRHAYLSWLGPLLAAALAAVIGGLLARVAGAERPERRSRLSARTATLAAAATLLAVFVAQESLESLLSGTGLPGLALALGGGGWVVIPIALGLGTMIALLTRTGVMLSRTAEVLRPRFRPVALARVMPEPSFIVAPGPLALHLASRAPPPAS